MRRQVAQTQVVALPKDFEHFAGQFAYLHFPTVSVLEWHPFTISSAPSDGRSITFHIRVCAIDRVIGFNNNCVPAEPRSGHFY